MVIKTFGDSNGSYYRMQNGTDGKRTSTGKLRVNPYYTAGGTCSNPPYDLASFVQQDPVFTSRRAYQHILNQLVEQYMSRLDSGLVAADLYYAKSTAQTATAQARRVLQAIRSIKRRDVRAIKYYFSKANSDFGRDRRGKRRFQRASLQIPEAYLQFNFVAKPLYKTMKNFIRVVDNPMMSLPYHLSTASVSDGVHSDNGVDDTTYSWSMKGGGSGRFMFTNPNEHLFTRMGFYDLPGLVWDIIPWSLALDMFTNIGKGLQLLNPRYSTIKVEQACWHVKFTHTSSHRWRKSGTKPAGSRLLRGTNFNRLVGPPSGWRPTVSIDLSLTQLTLLWSAITTTFARKFK